MRILVAGANGLAGSAVLRALLDAFPEAEARAQFRGDRGQFVRDPRVAWVRADLTDRTACRSVAEGCDAAVLAAAETGGSTMGTARRTRHLSANAVLDTWLFEALAEAGARRVVYVSTASVYQPFDGAMTEEGLDRNRPPDPSVAGAALAKRHGEALCGFWHEAAGMETVIARPTSLYGPGDAFDPQRSTVVAALIRKAVDRQDPFEIRGDPDVRRDILFADDFGRGVVTMLRRTDIVHDTFNLGAGETVTVGEIGHWACAAAGHRPADIRHGTPGGVASARAVDIGKATRVLDWRPRVSARDGIARTVDWWKENGESWPK